MKKFYRIALAMAAFAVVFASCTKSEPVIGTNDSDGVFINKCATTLIKGSSEKLVVTVTPKSDTHIQWESSNPAIATVDGQGVVTAVAAGEVDIIAKTGVGNVKCAVFVASPVTNVNLSEEIIAIDAQQTAGLTFTVGPDDHNIPFTPVWISTNKDVCTVAADRMDPAKAIITAKRGGYATIILSIGDINTSCDIHVIPDPDHIYYGDVFQLGLGDRPATAPEHWTSSCEKVAIVDQYGNVEVKYTGEATISVEADGQSKEFTFTAKINPAYQTFTESQKTSAYNTAKNRALNTTYGQYYSCPIYYQASGAVSANYYQTTSYYTYFHEKTGNHNKFGAHYKSGSNDRRMEFEFDGEIVEGACYPASVYTLYHNDMWHSEVIESEKTNVEIYKIEQGKVMVLVNFFETFTGVMRQAYFMDTIPE